MKCEFCGQEASEFITEHVRNPRGRAFGQSHYSLKYCFRCDEQKREKIDEVALKLYKHGHR
jgi:hypothetical protein